MSDRKLIGYRIRIGPQWVTDGRITSLDRAKATLFLEKSEVYLCLAANGWTTATIVRVYELVRK